MIRLDHVRYFLTGIANTAFSYLSASFLMYVGLTPQRALLASAIFSVFFNYCSYRFIAFKRDGSIFKFLINHCLLYFFSAVILYLFILLIKSKYVALALTTFFVAILNYFIMSKWIFIEGKR